MTVKPFLAALSVGLSAVLLSGTAQASDNKDRGSIDADVRLAGKSDGRYETNHRTYERRHKDRRRYDRGRHDRRYYDRGRYDRDFYGHRGGRVRVETIVTSRGFVKELSIRRGRVIDSRIVGRVGRHNGNRWRHHSNYYGGNGFNIRIFADLSDYYRHTGRRAVYYDDRYDNRHDRRDDRYDDRRDHRDDRDYRRRENDSSFSDQKIKSGNIVKGKVVYDKP